MLKRLLLLTIALASPTLYGGTVTGNLQGPSGIAVKNATLTFTLQQAGLLIGTGNIAQLTSQCYSSTDGSVVGLPNPLQPTTVAVGPTATLPAGIYYLRFTFYNSAGESLPSPEFHIQTTVLQSLIVSPPASFPPNATGMNVYIGTTPGSETLQGSTSTATQQYTQSVPLVSGSTPPGANTAPCAIAFNDTIIPYGGYNVSLTSATGSAYPGWPQAWQMNGGPNGTINVSQGAPLWNGVVVYPMPILSQPLNHGPQSISGPLDFGGYDVTNVGNFTAGSVNSVINANLQSGADIGAKVNNSIALCATQCTVYVPAGSYSYATPIVIPMGVIGKFKLELDTGADLTYTGTGDAIIAQPTGSPSFANLTISGGRLEGNGSANGVHIVASSFINIDHMAITGFDFGILLDGPNTVNVDHNFIEGNQIGIEMIPTFCTLNVCGPTPSSGSGFTTNAVHIEDNSIVQNQQWGIQDANAQPSNTGSLGNLIQGNDLENNGGAGNTFGAIQIFRGTGYHITDNYFEGSPREIVIGTLPLGSPFYFSGQQTTIDSNYFTELIGTPYSIELINAVYTRIENNATDDVTMNSSNCFVNAGAGSTAENHTLFGQNDVQLSGGGRLLCQNGALIQNFVGSGSYQTYNQNFNPRLVFQAFPITAASSDSVPAQFVVPTSSCFAVASNNGSQATAQGLVDSVYVQASGTPGAATIFHPTGNAGLLFDIWCSGPPNL